MKLWIDDQILDPSTPDRHPPEGWTGCSSTLAACRLIASGKVTSISLDHDLGPRCAGSGYTIARFIEKRAADGSVGPMIWRVHSANPVGRVAIERAMKSAERFWNRS